MAEVSIPELIARSAEAKEEAYCRYSNFRVGAALLTKDGTVYKGCNVENSAYSMAICAERTALTKAVSEGHREFKSIAVTSDLEDVITPCGACRQFLVEFGSDIDVYMTRLDGTYIKMTSGELLPLSFTPEHLENFQKTGK